MTALLERQATAAFELIGFELPAKQPAFGVPAATPCDGDEIRSGGWDDPAAGLTVKFPTTGFRVEAARPCNGDDDAKLVEYRPTSSVDGFIKDAACQFDTGHGEDTVTDRAKLGVRMSHGGGEQVDYDEKPPARV